jgi:cephalosporin hydroxylase
VPKRVSRARKQVVNKGKQRLSTRIPPAVTNATLRAFFAAIQQKNIKRIQSFGTFFDNWMTLMMAEYAQNKTLQRWKNHIDQLPIEESIYWDKQFKLLNEIARRFNPKRYVLFDLRDAIPNAYFESFNLIMSQGCPNPIQWKGIPILKTAFEFAIYPMLIAELKPKLIVEIGSGTGGSAAWLAHVSELESAPTPVVSFDIRPPPLVAKNVNFIKCNCECIELTLPHLEPFLSLRPWMVIEDAHVNVIAVMEFFNALLTPGDYIIIEDSRTKRALLREFEEAHRGEYTVDTYYTDYFGFNQTCAANAILRKS